MIYRNGKKISAIYRNGKSIGQIFRNGKLVWQKAKPAAKRVKSITVSIPAWGTEGRIEWESIFRAIPKAIDNYYFDVAINGNGVRLRGNGGKFSSTVEWPATGTTAKIVIPDNLFVTTDEVYVGADISFTAKVPAVTSSPTYTNYVNDETISWQFENAPFFKGSGFATLAAFFWKPGTYTLNADLTGNATGTSGAVQASGTAESLGPISKEYSGADFTKMATYLTASKKKLIPSFYLSTKGGYIGVNDQSVVTSLGSPACSLAFKYKITSIETY